MPPAEAARLEALLAADEDDRPQLRGSPRAICDDPTESDEVTKQADQPAVVRAIVSAVRTNHPIDAARYYGGGSHRGQRNLEVRRVAQMKTHKEKNAPKQAADKTTEKTAKKSPAGVEKALIATLDSQSA